MSNVRAHAEQSFLSGDRESARLTVREQVRSTIEDVQYAAGLTFGVLQAIVSEIKLIRESGSPEDLADNSSADSAHLED